MKKIGLFTIICLMFISCNHGYSYGGYLFLESEDISDGLIFAGYDVDKKTIVNDKVLSVPLKFYGKDVVAIGYQMYETVLSKYSNSWESLRGLTKADENYPYRHISGVGYDNDIEKIVIPSSIQTVYPYAFFNCSDIKTVYIYSSTPPFGNGDLPKTKDLKIYVPSESIGNYKNSISWSKYSDCIFAIE